MIGYNLAVVGTCGGGGGGGGGAAYYGVLVFKHAKRVTAHASDITPLIIRYVWGAEAIALERVKQRVSRSRVREFRDGRESLK